MEWNCQLTKVGPLDNKFTVFLKFCHRCVPEALLENIYHYLVAAKRFEITGMTIESLPNLECILSLLLVFMSGSMRAHNPHLRAQLAECLECLLPQEKGASQLNRLTREQLFLTHPYRAHVSFNHFEAVCSQLET